MKRGQQSCRTPQFRSKAGAHGSGHTSLHGQAISVYDGANFVTSREKSVSYLFAARHAVVRSLCVSALHRVRSYLRGGFERAGTERHDNVLPRKAFRKLPIYVRALLRWQGTDTEREWKLFASDRSGGQTQLCSRIIAARADGDPSYRGERGLFACVYRSRKKRHAVLVNSSEAEFEKHERKLIALAPVHLSTAETGTEPVKPPSSIPSQPTRQMQAAGDAGRSAQVQPSVSAPDTGEDQSGCTRTGSGRRDRKPIRKHWRQRRTSDFL